MKIKVVFNKSFGGFGLSALAIKLLEGLGVTEEQFCEFELGRKRHNVNLVTVIEDLGKEANSLYSDLHTREIPFGALYRIDEYDGKEMVVLQDEYHWERAE